MKNNVLRFIFSFILFLAVATVGCAQTHTHASGNGGGGTVIVTVTPSPGPSSSATASATGPKFGSFFRIDGTPPYGVQATSGSSPLPNPYPTLPSSTLGVPAYCYGTDSVGSSIATSNLLSQTKMTNILDLNLKWTRFGVDPFFMAGIYNPSSPSYNWSYVDSPACWQFLHGIEPVTNIGVGGVQYEDSTTTFSPHGHVMFDTPAQYVGYVQAVVQHMLAFGFHKYSLPNNEVNSWYFDINSPFAGTPKVAIANPASGGTLTVGSSYAYRVSATTATGETEAGPEEAAPVTETAGNGSMLITWGPLAGATGYKIYGRTSGSEQLIASVSSSTLSYTDNGSISPSGALPTPSRTTQVNSVEADIAAYMKPAYAAIKAIDPNAVIYGFELNEDGGLTPSAAQFVSDERTIYACGPGTCYDGISAHMALRYPDPTPAPSGTPVPCYPNAGGDYTMACKTDLETAAGQEVPIMVGEFAEYWPSSLADAPTAALAFTDALKQLTADPDIKYINFANVDECGLYDTQGNYFANGCLIDLFNNRVPMWFSAAAYSIPLAQPTPQVAPTVIAFTTPSPTPTATPVPTATPSYAALVQTASHFISPITLSNTPSPGDYMAIMEAWPFGPGTTVADSAATPHAYAYLDGAGAGPSAQGDGGVITTGATNVLNSSNNEGETAWELTGVNSTPTFTHFVTTSSGTTASVGPITVQNGQFLGISYSSDNSSITALPTTNLGTVVSDYNGGIYQQYHVFATGTGSMTISFSGLTSGSKVSVDVMQFANASGNPAPTPSPSPSATAVAIVNEGCGFTTPINMSGAPTAGNFLTFSGTFNFNNGGAFTDSTPTTYPLISGTMANQGSSGMSTYVYGGVVTGTPTSSITTSATEESCGLEVKHFGTPVGYSAVVPALSGTTETTQTFTTGAGSLVFGHFRSSAGESGATLTASNGTPQILAGDSGNNNFYYFPTTATSSATLTVTTSNGDQVNISWEVIPFSF